MTRTATLLLALTGILITVGCGKRSPRPEWVDPATTTLLTKIDRGKKLFTSSGCVNCHVIGDQPAVREGPDLTYFGVKAQRSGYAGPLLDPAQPAPKAKPDHPKLPDNDQRSAITLYLSQSCKPKNYSNPGNRAPKCAVTGVRVDPQAPLTVHRPHGGTTIYLYDAATARKFDLDPSHFSR